MGPALGEEVGEVDGEGGAEELVVGRGEMMGLYRSGLHFRMRDSSDFPGWSSEGRLVVSVRSVKVRKDRKTSYKQS